MKPSANVMPYWEGVVSRGEATHLYTMTSSLSMQYLQANRPYSPCRRAFLYVYMYMNYLQRGFFAARSMDGYLPDN